VGFTAKYCFLKSFFVSLYNKKNGCLFSLFFILKKHQKNIFHILALEKNIYFSIFIKKKKKNAYFDLINNKYIKSIKTWLKSNSSLDQHTKKIKNPYFLKNNK